MRETIAGDRYVLSGLVLLVAFFSCVAVAVAYRHTTNGVHHGLADVGVPHGQTVPPGNQWSSVAVRHYFDENTWEQQCYEATYGSIGCHGHSWGTAPCKKRYVGGTEGLMARHWVRLGPSCPGQIHG
jgi:hypothetical protein